VHKIRLFYSTRTKSSTNWCVPQQFRSTNISTSVSGGVHTSFQSELTTTERHDYAVNRELYSANCGIKNWNVEY